MDKIEQRRKEILHELCKIEVVEVIEDRKYIESVILGIACCTYRGQIINYKHEMAKQVSKIEEPTLDLCWLIKNEKVEVEDRGCWYSSGTIPSDLVLFYKGTSIDLSVFNDTERSAIKFYLVAIIYNQCLIKSKKQAEEKERKRQELTKLLTQAE